jgi:hypothetical protein
MPPEPADAPEFDVDAWPLLPALAEAPTQCPCQLVLTQ